MYTALKPHLEGQPEDDAEVDDDLVKRSLVTYINVLVLNLFFIAVCE